MSSIHLRIVTPQGLYKELDTPIVNIETLDGQEGILPEHMPVVTMLKIGKMSVDEEDGRNEYAVAGGLFYFRSNQAEILTDAVENRKDIDEGRASRAKERAEQRLHSGDPAIDLKRAEIALKKAVNRLEVYGLK